MSKAQDIFGLLKQREGEWVRRDDINFVGGEAADRRMRELREQIALTGQYRLDERPDATKRLEFRLVAIPQTTDTERYQWECVTCQSYPYNIAATQAAIDRRWRLGHCVACRKPSTFQQVRREA